MRYKREQKYDKRISRGDDFAGDAWSDTQWENMITYVAVGIDPNKTNRELCHIAHCEYGFLEPPINGKLKISYRDKLNSIIQTIEFAMNAKKALNMASWQKSYTRPGNMIRDIQHTFEEFITCGTSACFGGYLAMDPVFRACGGEMLPSGCPKFLNDEPGEYTKIGDNAVSSYFGWDYYFTSIFCFTCEDTELAQNFYEVHSPESVSFENLLEKLYAIRDDRIDPFDYEQ